MGPTTCTICIDVPTLAAGTDDEREVAVPWPGTWRLVAAYFTPSTAVSASDSVYETIALKKGAAGSTIASWTTQVTGGAALVKGTPKAFDLTGAGVLAEIVGQTGCVEIVKTHASTGSVLDGSFTLAFEKVAGT